MLPMEDWERYGMLLTIGLIPMLIANILGFLFVNREAAMIKYFIDAPSCCAASLGLASFGVLALVIM